MLSKDINGLTEQNTFLIGSSCELYGSSCVNFMGHIRNKTLGYHCLFVVCISVSLLCAYLGVLFQLACRPEPKNYK